MPKRRKSKPLVWIPVTGSLNPSTLADNAVFKATLWTANEDFFLVGAKLSASLHTGTSGEGPLEIGLADNDLSTTEIQECLDASPSTPRDRIAIEQGRRPVRSFAQFDGQETHEKIADGMQIKVPCKFTIYDDSELALWVRNRSDASLTGGQIINVSGKIYGRWRV